MARVTVEDCIDKVPNRFGLVLLSAHRARGNAEYEQMLVVPKGRLSAFLAKVGEGLVPPAREFLIRAGLTNRSPDSSR